MLDFESYYTLHFLMQDFYNLRQSSDYESYLAELSQKGDYEKREVALHCLSQMNFSEITPFEENYVLLSLESGDLCLQEEALNALLLWDNTTQIERIKKITITSKFLQDDLDEFIAEMERK